MNKTRQYSEIGERPFLWFFDLFLLLPVHLEVILLSVGLLLREGEGHHLLVELGGDSNSQRRHVDLKMILPHIRYDSLDLGRSRQTVLLI
jgi:hypothetical protein